MDKINLSLASRVEDVREARKIQTPVKFSKEEIKKHFDDSVNIIKSQFNVAKTLLKGGDQEGCKMVWRSQIVLVEGLLDFYMHEVSKYCMFQMFCDNWEKTEKYNNFMVPMSNVEKAIKMASSKDWFFEYLNDRFSRDVFLSADSMKDQLNMIGLGFANTMVKAFPSNNENDSLNKGKEIIQNLFNRRNKIAHQNDRDHATASQTDITMEYVEQYIREVECIVKSIDALIKEKDSPYNSK